MGRVLVRRMLACVYAFILVLLVTMPCSAARTLRDGSGNSFVEESHKTGKLPMKWSDRQTGDGTVPAKLDGSDRMYRQWARLLIEEIHVDYADPAPNPSAPYNATP